MGRASRKGLHRVGSSAALSADRDHTGATKMLVGPVNGSWLRKQKFSRKLGERPLAMQPQTTPESMMRACLLFHILLSFAALLAHVL